MRTKQKKGKKLDNIMDFISKNILEIILITGLFFIILASFIVNSTLGLYVLGTILTLLSLYLARR